MSHRVNLSMLNLSNQCQRHVKKKDKTFILFTAVKTVEFKFSSQLRIKEIDF